MQKTSPRQSSWRVLFGNPADGRFTGLISSFVIILCVFYSLKANAATYNGTITFYPTTTLNAVILSELGLSSAGTANSEGTYTADVTWAGDTIEQIMSVDQVYSSTVVQRNNVTIWYYKYNKNEKKPTFTVSYRIFSTNGIENKLSLYNDTSSTINATITALPVTSPSGSGTYRYIYGNVNIIIDIANAKKSGTYQGSVQVAITYI